MERLNVMVVEDSSIAGHVLSTMLTTLGHKVVRTARTGAEAVAGYSACIPDVVIMDITMPDMDGILASEKILSSYPDARIVVASAHAERSVVVKARSVGVKGYILKPIQPEKLRSTLENVMSPELQFLNS